MYRCVLISGGLDRRVLLCTEVSYCKYSILHASSQELTVITVIRQTKEAGVEEIMST